jgi:hypothetical protein
MSTRRPRLKAMAFGALTVSVVPMVTAAAAAGTNVIYNPGFAHRLNGWRVVVVARGSDPGYPHISVLRTTLEPVQKCDVAQRGHPYLEMDVPRGADGYVEQEVIVPVNPGRLTFRTWSHLEPVTVTVSVVSGPVVHQLLSYNPPALQATPSSCSGLKPIIKSLNMARYAGEAVGLRIQATSHGDEGTTADFDNLVLEER